MRIEVPLSNFTVNKNYQITIPRIIREAMGLKVGDQVEFSQIIVEKGEVVCKIKVMPKEKQAIL